MSCNKRPPQTPVLKWEIFTIISAKQTFVKFCLRTQEQKGTTLQVFLTHFSAFKMVCSPKTFLKNLFEMLIKLSQVPNGLPRGVCGKQALLTCYIGTCRKKIQSELLFKSKRCSAAHSKIGNLSCESWRRLLMKEKQDALVYTT